MPTLESAPPASRAKARGALARRRLNGGVRYFQPVTAEQLRFLSNTKTGALAIGGNRAGKTECGAAETVWRLLGEHPYKTTHRPPIFAWAASQELPGSTDKPHTQLEKLRKLIPKDALRGGCWERAYAPGAYTLTLANGSRVQFKSYDQGPLKFESAACHWIWFDEEPPDKKIFTSSLMRLTDYRGAWGMTATPILSLEGAGWIEELWDQRLDENRSFEAFQLYTTDNTTLDKGMIEELLSGMSEEERKVRSQGAFARVGGQVLREYDEQLHGVADFLPPPDWEWFVVMDFGFRNCTAHLWAARRPGDGHVFLVAEHYEKELPPATHMRIAHFMWQALGSPENLRVIGDPAGFNVHSGSTGAETPADIDEYRKAAKALKAEWFQPTRASNGDPFAYRVKRYLACHRMSVCQSLKHWRWEADRWTYAKERGGIAATEQHLPEKPKKKDNHLMDTTRYLCNALPEPKPAPTAPKAWTWEREQMQRAAHNPLGSEF